MYEKYCKQYVTGFYTFGNDIKRSDNADKNLPFSTIQSLRSHLYSVKWLYVQVRLIFLYFYVFLFRCAMLYMLPPLYVDQVA